MSYSIIKQEYREYPPFRSWRSIRNKSLQKLLILRYEIERTENKEHSELYKTMLKRMKDKEPHCHVMLMNMIWYLQPKDVMTILHCTRRTAIDYIHTLRRIYGS